MLVAFMTFPATTTPTDTPEARRYNRIRRRLGIADFVLGFAMLVVLLVTGWTRDLRDISYVGAWQIYSLAVFFYIGILLVIGKALGCGLDLYGFYLEHRFHLSNQKLGSWLWDQVKGFLVGLVFAGIVVEIIYYVLRMWPRQWWLIAWGAFIVLFVALAQIAPVVLFPIFYKFQPLQREELKQRLVHLSERAGTRIRGVYEWKLSEKSKKANAALTGLGKTRRIILADTLLTNYSDDEIEAVLAHELGHHVRRHILKGILLEVAVTFVGFWAANEVLRWAVFDRHMFESLADFANLPLLALVSTVLSLVLMPVLNAYSRQKEREADQYCFESISSVQPFISSMNKLADQNLAERSPSRLVEVLFHSHPAISKRIEAAREYSEHEGEAVSAQ